LHFEHLENGNLLGKMNGFLYQHATGRRLNGLNRYPNCRFYRLRGVPHGRLRPRSIFRKKIYTWEQGTLCPDCLEDRIREMRTDELAVLLGCESAVVGTAKRDGRRKEWRFAVTDLLENSEALDGSDRRE
jgi:hypothetical protein